MIYQIKIKYFVLDKKNYFLIIRLMEKVKICIINYGMGNIHSVFNAIKEIGFDPTVSNKGEDLDKSDFFILPGVGAFETAMNSLNHLGLTDIIRNQVLIKKKY